MASGFAEVRRTIAERILAVVFDLDGTAVPNGCLDRPSRELVDVIRCLQPRLRVCLATGRPWSSAQRAARELNLRDPVVVGGGSRVIQPDSGDVLWETLLSAEKVRQILSALRDCAYPVLFDEEQIECGLPAAERAPVSVATLYVMSVPEDDQLVLRTAIESVEGVACRLGRPWTGDGMDLHVTTFEATKRESILRLWSHLGIDSSATAGFGDGENDLGLFEAVGWRVAVRGAPEELLRISDDLCDSPEQDGLAKYLASMFLDEDSRNENAPTS